MKITVRYIILGLFVLFSAIELRAGTGNPIRNDWRNYDINGDGKFDVADIDKLIDRGWHNIDFDLNEDGKKDVDDVLALFLKLSVMDRSCNRIVNDDDFKPIDPVSLPNTPGIQTVRRIVNECVVQAQSKLPFDIQQQAFKAIPQGKPLTLAERTYVYQMAGISGLAQENLDAAKWGFGKAFQTDERSPAAIGSLAFCMAVDGNDKDALLLLAFARYLYRESAPTATSLGWVFARHGQNEEALEYFLEAVFYAPKIAQYHMNLGIILMRLNRKEEAWKAFKEATELEPSDAKKFLFYFITKPTNEPPKEKELDQEEFRKSIDVQIREMKEQGYGQDELPTPWDQMSPCEQAGLIPEILAARYGEQMEKIAQSYADDLARRMENVIKPFLPQWDNIKSDWDRYFNGLPVVFKAGINLNFEAEMAAGQREAALTRQMGSELLGYRSFFMESVLQQVQIDVNMVINRWRDLPITAQSFAEIKADAYKDALEDNMRYCYKYPIDQAYRWLSTKSSPYGLPFPKVECIEAQDFNLLFLIIPLRCFDIPGYCPDEDGGEPPEIEMPGDNTIGIDLWIVSFEWNTDTNEFEFNAGQGIIVGVTWKPETGFGFQIGAGVRGGAGFMAGEMAIYARFDEGKCTIQTEVGGSIGFGPASLGHEFTETVAVLELP